MITEVELSVEERTQIAEDEIQKALLETDLRRTLSMIARALLQVGPNPNLEAKSARADLFYRVYHECAASSLWEESSDELELTDSRSAWLFLTRISDRTQRSLNSLSTFSRGAESLLSCRALTA